MSLYINDTEVHTKHWSEFGNWVEGMEAEQWPTLTKLWKTGTAPSEDVHKELRAAPNPPTVSHVLHQQHGTIEVHMGDEDEDEYPEHEWVLTASIQCDPERLQYRDFDGDDGLSEDRRHGDFDIVKCPPLHLWKDEDGQIQVVDGHKRLARAKAAGEPLVPAIFMHADDADDAKAQGERLNKADDIYHHLEHSPIVSSSPLVGSGSENKVHKLNLESGHAGVFKPMSGAGPHAWDASELQHPREVAAHHVAKALGWGHLVPHTTYREHEEHGVGSIQHFQMNAEPGGRHRSKLSDDFVHKAATFDYIIGQRDRHMHNYIYQPHEKKFHLIDNGYAFPRHHLSTNIYSEMGELAGHQKPAKTKAKWEDIEPILKEHKLEPDTIEATKKRFELVKSGKYTLANLYGRNPDQLHSLMNYQHGLTHASNSV